MINEKRREVQISRPQMIFKPKKSSRTVIRREKNLDLRETELVL